MSTSCDHAFENPPLLCNLNGARLQHVNGGFLAACTECDHVAARHNHQCTYCFMRTAMVIMPIFAVAQVWPAAALYRVGR